MKKPVKLFHSVASQLTAWFGSIPAYISLSQFFKHQFMGLFPLPLGTPMASLLKGKSSLACAGILIHMGGARKCQFVNHLPKMYDM